VELDLSVKKNKKVSSKKESLHKPSIFVIIITFNALHWINNCLKSLRKSTLQVSPVVIDNNSNDNTVEIIKTYYPEVTLIENKDNLGFGKANNIGIRYALANNADYVFLLNQDAWIEPETLNELVSVFQLFPKTGLVSPVHLMGTGLELDFNFSNYIKYKTLNEIIKVRQNIILCETDFVNAAAWLLTAECIRNVGGFDPLFVHYGEDKDFCQRLKFHKYEIKIGLKSIIYHDRKYDKANAFRNYHNRVLASGLALIKDINHNIVRNYLSWFLERLPKIIKAFFSFKLNTCLEEVRIIYKLIILFPKINKSRELSISTEMPYLTPKS
jgi:GT2 family glycosyltransferase